MEQRLTYTVRELAGLLGVSEHHAYEGLRSGTIPCYKLGTRYVIPRASIAAWLANAGKPGKPTPVAAFPETGVTYRA
jgi:excisionase family DNA binding protein